VFNKLKHRFMLIGELHKYAALPNKKEYEVVAIATDGTRVRQLMEAVRQASMGAAEIASLIYELDAEGVPV
jgi:hypothetical protein